MWICLTALLACADPGPSGARAAFDRMEQQILKCKSLQVELQASTMVDKKPVTPKGRLLIAPGNKLRFELECIVSDKTEKIHIVSDGINEQMIYGGGWSGIAQNTKKDLGKTAFITLSRSGILTAISLCVAYTPGVPTAPDIPEQKGEFDPEKIFPISGLKFGKKETVAGVEAQAIQYQIASRFLLEPIAATVWVDVKTNLPVKRVVILKHVIETLTITEFYTKAVVDGLFDEKKFELPK